MASLLLNSDRYTYIVGSHHPPYPVSNLADETLSNGYKLSKRPPIHVHSIIKQMRDVCYPLSCPRLLNHIIYIDGAYVPTVSLVVGMLHVQAPVHVLRARWGLSRCRRHRGEHRVICLDQDRGTRRAAICGRIR